MSSRLSRRAALTDRPQRVFNGRVRGYRLEVMAPREQRFVPSYPFAAVEELRRVRSVLKATAPAS
eukprot:2830309-Rhodomonas_salina.1